MILGYPQANVDQFVPDPDNPKDNPIIGQPNARQRRLLLCALRSQRDRLEKLTTRTPAGQVLSNARADLDTTKELIATLQL